MYNRSNHKIFGLNAAERVSMSSRKNGNSFGRRTVRRVRLRIPFGVSGRDERGFAFHSLAESVNISSKGGCLILDKDLAKGQHLKLVSPRGSSFLVNVRWSLYLIRRNIRLVGFTLTGSSAAWVLSDRVSMVE